MAYYQLSGSYHDYSDYQSDSRRNSNSFSEEVNGAKRKKTNWSGRGRRRFNRGGGNSKPSAATVTIDTPLFQEPRRTPPPPRPIFQEPKRTPPPPRRSPQIPARRGRERSNPFRSNANTTPYFDAREMPEFIEPEHVGPSWHWENYVHGCKNWQDKHKLAYYQSRCTALEFENQMLFEQINQLIKENIVFATERGRTPTMEVPDIPGYGTQEVGGRSSKNQGKSSQPSTAGSDIEFNLTEDVVEFLETNIRHKLTLKKEKVEKGKTSAEAKPKEEKKDASPKISAAKRKDELEQLYGQNSALIQGLETSLQLNFNRNCDTFKPEMYPATPLNLQTVAD